VDVFRAVGRADARRARRQIRENGFTLVTFVDPQSPMLRQISTIDRRVVTAVFRGSDSFVFQPPDGWKTGRELPRSVPGGGGSSGGSDYWISLQSAGEELEIIVGRLHGAARSKGRRRRHAERRRCAAVARLCQGTAVTAREVQTDVDPAERRG